MVNSSIHHIGLGHTTLAPNNGHYSLINAIDIINLDNKALDIRKRKRKVEECSMVATLLLLGP